MFNVDKITKNGHNHNKNGRKHAIFPKSLFKWACPFKTGQLLYTAKGRVKKQHYFYPHFVVKGGGGSADVNKQESSKKNFKKKMVL